MHTQQPPGDSLPTKTWLFPQNIFHLIEPNAKTYRCTVEELLTDGIYSTHTVCTVEELLTDGIYSIHTVCTVEELLTDGICSTHTVWSQTLIILQFLSVALSLSDRLAEGEFIKGVTENENAMRLIHYEPITD